MGSKIQQDARAFKCMSKATVNTSRFGFEFFFYLGGGSKLKSDEKRPWGIFEKVIYGSRRQSKNQRYFKISTDCFEEKFHFFGGGGLEEGGGQNLNRMKNAHGESFK